MVHNYIFKNSNKLLMAKRRRVRVAGLLLGGSYCG